jgi:D-glycero-alpha-D-manno-heptose-7-phosphate kinase
MGVEGVRRERLDVDLDSLESRLVLAYTGASRNSGINNWDAMVRRINGDAAVIDAFDAIAGAAAAMRDALDRADWDGVAAAMNAEWAARARLAPGVTTPEIDTLLRLSREAGAVAGKACGAGGGGCLIALAPPERRDAVGAAFERGGARLLDFSLDSEGLQVTKVPDDAA